MFELNLISPERKKMLRDGVGSHMLTILFSWLLIIVILDTAALYGIQTYLQRKLTSVETELSNTKVVSPTGKTLPVIELTKQINQQLNTLGAFSRQVNYAQYMTDIGLNVPDGIVLSAYEYSLKDRNIELTGNASSRNDVPLFEKKLESLSYVEKLTTVTNLNERTNISFNITLSLRISDAKQ